MIDIKILPHDYILSIVSRANKMIAWMVRKFISREVNVLKIYKTLIKPHIEYCTPARAHISRHRNWRVMLRLEGIQKRVTKIILKSKRLQLQGQIEGIWINYFTRKK